MNGYAFIEPNGTRWKGMQSVDTNWEAPRNGKVPVRYTAGEDDSSRFVGRARWLDPGFVRYGRWADWGVHGPPLARRSLGTEAAAPVSAWISIAERVSLKGNSSCEVFPCLRPPTPTLRLQSRIRLR